MNGLLFFQTVRLMTRLLPRRACYAIARPFAGWAYRRNLATREAIEENLRVVLHAQGHPAAAHDLERLVRRNFIGFGKYMVDFFKIGALSPESQQALIRVEHLDYLQQCVDMNKGVIVLTAHLGNWELGAVVAQQCGFRINAVVREQPTPRLDALFQAQRVKRGVQVLPMNGAALSVPACLKRNEIVVLLADMNYSGGDRSVPFFGQAACLPQGPAVLAKRSGAPILPAFVLRQADDTFCFRAYPPILPDRSQSIGNIQEQICAVLESVIGEYPDQWFAYQRVWPQDGSKRPASSDCSLTGG